jgi:hypothetical protein
MSAPGWDQTFSPSKVARPACASSRKTRLRDPAKPLARQRVQVKSAVGRSCALDWTSWKTRATILGQRPLGSFEADDGAKRVIHEVHVYDRGLPPSSPAAPLLSGGPCPPGKFLKTTKLLLRQFALPVREPLLTDPSSQREVTLYVRLGHARVSLSFREAALLSVKCRAQASSAASERLSPMSA